MTNLDRGSNNKKHSDQVQEQILHQLENIENRLFKDNGRKSLQTRINTNALHIKLLLTFTSVFIMFFLGLLAHYIKTQIGA